MPTNAVTAKRGATNPKIATAFIPKTRTASVIRENKTEVEARNSERQRSNSTRKRKRPRPDKLFMTWNRQMRPTLSQKECWTVLRKLRMKRNPDKV